MFWSTHYDIAILGEFVWVQVVIRGYNIIISIEACVLVLVIFYWISELWNQKYEEVSIVI